MTAAFGDRGPKAMDERVRRYAAMQPPRMTLAQAEAVLATPGASRQERRAAAAVAKRLRNLATREENRRMK